MPKYRITGPDGGTYEVTAPDGASEADVMAYAQANYKPTAAPAAAPAPDAGFLKNAAAGLVKGASELGATILSPVDAAARALNGGKPVNVGGYDIVGQDRRGEVDGFMKDQGVDTDSLAYGGGKLVAEVAGTAGAGGLIAKGARLVPAIASRASPLLTAVESGGMSAGGAGLATRAGGGAITGAASAGMVNPDQALTGAVVGGALPVGMVAAGRGAQAVGRAIRGKPMAPEVNALAKRAGELGIDIPADRLVDSKPMNALAAALNYVPMSGRAATEDAMASQLNRRLSNTFGQDSSNVTMALRKADDVLGGQFDTFLQKNTVKVDPQFMNDLAEAANQASKELGSDGAGIIGKQVDEILSKAATGQIDGQAAYNIKKTLDRIGKRNSPEAFYALDLKHKLMDALNRSVGPDEAAAFAGLRQQYGAMLDLQKLARNGAEGEISIARLANMKNIRNPEMQELADIAAQFVKPREGQHGAAQRAAAGAITFGLAGPAGLATGAAAGRGLNSLLNSQSAKSMVLGEAPQIPNRLAEALRQGAYRTAPLIPAQ